MFKFITNKSFFVNLLVIILAIMLLIFIFFSLLGVITKHSENQKVPYVIGRSYDDAKQILEAAGLEAGIQDSIYVDSAKALQVIRQSPDADAVVKSDRTIYLTINRSVPPQIDMPDLRGFSFKSAELYLQSLGLKVGETSYVPDIARNAVKEQLFNGQPVVPGTKVNMGSLIGLVLGSGIGDTQMNVPDLTGMTVEQARSYLISSNIELGDIIVVEPLTDTSSAYIVKQSPQPFVLNANSEMVPNQISAGQLIVIYISKNPPAKDTSVAPLNTPSPN